MGFFSSSKPKKTAEPEVLNLQERQIIEVRKIAAMTGKSLSRCFEDALNAYINANASLIRKYDKRR